MKITASKEMDKKQEVLVAGLFEEDTDNCSSFSKALAQELEEAGQRKVFLKKFGETYPAKVHDLPYHKIFVLGLGPRKEFTLDKLRQALGKAVTAVKSASYVSMSTNITEKLISLGHFNPESVGRATAEGLLLADYNFIKYLAKDKQEKKKPLSVAAVQWSGIPATFTAGLATGRIVAESANMVRDLVNEPANVVDSEYMEKAARQIAAQHGS
ncbi:MAG: M17 family peptidase N-terminal domain-containing protein, partial [Nanoarchaeota archaeon]